MQNFMQSNSLPNFNLWCVFTVRYIIICYIFYFYNFLKLYTSIQLENINFFTFVSYNGFLDCKKCFNYFTSYFIFLFWFNYLFEVFIISFRNKRVYCIYHIILLPRKYIKYYYIIILCVSIGKATVFVQWHDHHIRPWQ